MDTILDNIGLPYSGINLTHATSGRDRRRGRRHHGLAEARPPADRGLRQGDRARSLPREFPGVTFYFLPADIITQILNFGLPAPIDIQIDGADIDGNRAVADRILEQVRSVPGIVDARIQQDFDYPISRSMSTAPRRSRTASPSRCRDQRAGHAERQLPDRADVLPELEERRQLQPRGPGAAVRHPVAAGSAEHPDHRAGAATQPAILADVATIKRSQEMAAVDHYNIRRVIDIYAKVQDRDLGAVGRDIDAHRRCQPPSPAARQLRHDPRPARDDAQRLYRPARPASAFSILLVYLLIVVNFQSWLDPFIIITALPAALAGIVLFLFFTGTTLSVPALMGAIMCMGVATANSILVVSFARSAWPSTATPIRPRSKPASPASGRC